MKPSQGDSGFLVKLGDQSEVAERTIAFHFEKPAEFKFKAGQFVDMTLIDPPETDDEGDLRSFSIASAPSEKKLLITTRMRDTAFKRVLKKLRPGAEVRIEGPFGNLVLREDTRRAAVMLAGGIGITPFRSMVVEAAAAKSAHRIFLFYSNRRPEDAPFLDELSALEKKNPNFTFVPTMTRADESRKSWQGHTGYIDAGFLLGRLKGIESPVYYIAGPPAMVHGLREMLKGAGIDGKDIRAEDFDGY